MKLFFNTSNIDEAIESVKKWKYRPPVVDKAKARAIADSIFNEGMTNFKFPARSVTEWKRLFKTVNELP